MVRSYALLVILFIIRVSYGQLQECPSCCNQTYTKDTIKTGVPSQHFWNCNEDEEFVIHVAKCFSECTYNVSIGTEFS